MAKKWPRARWGLISTVAAQLCARVSLSAAAPSYRYHPARYLDQACQHLYGLGLLIAVVMPIIDALDAILGVAKDSFGNVGSHTGTFHQGAGCAAKIVQRPSGYFSCLVERGL